jgi:hypothetical protein
MISISTFPPAGGGVDTLDLGRAELGRGCRRRDVHGALQGHAERQRAGRRAVGETSHTES